jgi:branched-chain amino acid transport system permease protein
MPEVWNQFLLFCLIYILLGWGLYLPYKAGQFTWSAAYCMSAGGYFAAYSSTAWDWPLPLVLVVTLVIGAVLAFIPALGLRKAPTFATVVATLAVLFILQSTWRNWGAMGGAAGIFQVPRPGYVLWLGFVLVFFIGALIFRLDRSRVGRAAEALLVNRDVAASLGVSLGGMSVALQTAAGVLGGLAGLLFAYGVGSVFPEAFGSNLVVIACAPLFVGGTSTLWGVVFIAPILWGIPLAVPGSVSGYKDFIIGGILIGVLLLRPEGLITRSTLRRISRFMRRERGDAASNSGLSEDGLQES